MYKCKITILVPKMEIRCKCTCSIVISIYNFVLYSICIQSDRQFFDIK